ncbi:hypothetical protein ACOSP7_016039 [Xanthoceras sorbifolium]
MKSSYFKDDTALQIASEEESDESIEETDVHDKSLILSDSSSFAVQNMVVECENGEPLVLAQAESRAFVPPLEVTLEDIEESEIDNVVSQSQEHIDEANMAVEKKKRSNKKAKKEREREIRDAETRLLEKDVPRTADEIERLVKSSPNSNFVLSWCTGFFAMLIVA